MELRARRVHDLLFDVNGFRFATDQGLWAREAIVAVGEVLSVAPRGERETAYCRANALGVYDPAAGVSELPLATLKKVVSTPEATLVAADDGFYVWRVGEDFTALSRFATPAPVLDLTISAHGFLVLHPTSLAHYTTDGALFESLPLEGFPVCLSGPLFPTVVFEDGSVMPFFLDPLAPGEVHAGPAAFARGALEVASLNATLIVGSRGPTDDGAWLFDHDLQAFMPAPWEGDSAAEIKAASFRDPYLAYADADTLYVADLQRGEIVSRLPILPPEDLLPLSNEGLWQSEPFTLGNVSGWVEADLDMTGSASGAQLELRAMAHGETRWQPWQTPDRWATQRPGSWLQVRVRLASPDGRRNAEVQGVTVRYADENRNPREHYLPLWDHQLIDRKTRTSLVTPVPLERADDYMAPCQTNLTFGLRAARMSYPIDLVVDAHDLDTSRLPSRLAFERAILYADARVLPTDRTNVTQLLLGTLEAPVDHLGVGINRLAYSSATQAMADGFPEWMAIRSASGSEGQKYLNAIALEFEELREQLRVLSDGRYLATATEEPSQVGIVHTLDGTPVVPDYPWHMAEDLASFYYNLNTPVAYQDPQSGVTYISLSHAPFTAQGVTYSLENGGVKALDLYNSLDTFGDLLGLKRLSAETNARYFDRLAAIFTEPANPTASGMQNALSRELGIPKEWVSLHHLGAPSFMAELLDDHGLPTERLRQYVKRIHSQALIRWGFFRWDESFWLDDNSEAYLPNCFDPILPTQKFY